MTRRYVLLQSGEAVPEPDLTAWALWMNGNDHIIRQDAVGDVLISTVFLGLDCNFTAHGPPLLFETMIVGGMHDNVMWRYATQADALKKHMWIVKSLSGGEDHESAHGAEGTQ